MNKVLFICKSRSTSYGIPIGLINSARFVAKALHHHNIETKVVVVTDGNSIDHEVHLYKPTYVMIEALWVTPAKIKELLKLHPKVRWAIRIHSKTPFLSMEGIAFEWINEYKIISEQNHNFILAPNNRGLDHELRDVLKIESTYLPNIYLPQTKFSCKVPDGIIDVGCFGAIRPFKNQLLQAIAAIKFADEIRLPMRFHINGDRVEQKGDPILKNIRALFATNSRHKLVEHMWMPHDEFIKLVGKMDIGMQVSFTESFNIVAADFVSQGIPIITSNDITWIPWIYRTDANSVDNIAGALCCTYKMRRFKFHYVNYVALWIYNKLAIKNWLKYLNG
jgi:hypothetical protein